MRRELDAEPESATVKLYEQLVASPAESAPAVKTLTIENMPAAQGATNPIGVEAPRSALTAATPRRKLARPIVIVGLVTLLAVIGTIFFLNWKNNIAIDSLVVLPFENRSNDPSLDYLSEGLTESIINNLAQIDSLRVMARATAFRYKNQVNEPLSVGGTY